MLPNMPICAKTLRTTNPVRRPAMLLAAMLLGHAWTAGGAAAAEPADAGIESCAGVTDDHQRLACFDREVGLMKAQRRSGTQAASATGAVGATSAAATSATSGAGTAAVPASQLTPEQRMGLTPGKILQLQGTANKSPDLKELSVKIRAVSTDATHRGVFRLDNGQVWQEVEPDAKFAVQPGDTVLITRGMLGSYFMSASAHMNTRVTRWQQQQPEQAP